MKEQPKISVIIYNYNTGVYAGRLLKSLHRDRYKNLEVVIVDDGSKDDSTNHIKQTVLNNEIKNAHLYQLPKHHGEYAAYNLALEKISGQYVIFSNALDEIDENFITALASSFVNGPTTLALTGIFDNSNKKRLKKYCSLTKIRKNDENTRAYFSRIKKHDNRLEPIFNKIFSVSVIRQKDLKFNPNNTSPNQKFITDYLKAAEVEKILTIDKPLYTRNSK